MLYIYQYDDQVRSSRQNDRKAAGHWGGGITLLSSAFAGSYQLKTDPDPNFKNPSGGTITTSYGTVPYIGGGASSSDDFVVDCKGTITVIYEWVPSQIPNPDPASLNDQDPSNDTINDPLDTPPESVISVETCTAKYSGEYWIPFGLGEGECNNGLGFSATTFNEPIIQWDWVIGGPPVGSTIGYKFGGTSEGTLYTKRSGGATITLTCSPKAKSMGLYGWFEASVAYSSSIIVPAVTLLGTTRFYTPHAIKLITGQGVTASLGSSGASTSGGGGLTIQAGSQTWSFSGGLIDPFKNFTYGSIGQRINHAAADMQGPTFNFFTNKAGSAKVVCNYKYNLPTGAKFVGGLPDFEAKSKEFESMRPEFIKWRVNDGSVALYPDRFDFDADADSTNGQQWYEVTFNLAAPFGNVGQGCFCQLITATRDLWRIYLLPGPRPEHFVKSPHNGVEAVDMRMPYPFGSVWNISGTGTGVDTPSQPLTWDAPFTHTWYRSKANDTFRTWAMYRPPAVGNQPTAYIPMAKYQWAWNGDATRTRIGNTTSFEPWQLIASDGGSLGGAVPTTDHPSWNKTSDSPFGFAPGNNYPPR